MKVYLERPCTDWLFLIFIATNANPKVCTVPAKVKIRENYPSLKTKYIRRTIMPSMLQETISSLLKNPISFLS